MARYPVLMPSTVVTVSNAGVPDDVMAAIVALFIVAVAHIGPPLVLLFALLSRGLLGSGGHGGHSSER